MAPPPPELMDDAVGEVLLRLPPDDPALLFRASLVCKPWRRLLTDPAFLRCYRAFHRTPPVLGFFRNMDFTARFVPTAPSRPRFAKRRKCRVLDCRHGRVLLDDYTAANVLLWDPVSGEDRRIPIPNDIKVLSSFNAAVLCAVAGCDHLDCHGGPFLVVLIAIYRLDDEGEWFTRAWVYSSEAGEWSAPTNVGSQNHIEKLPPVLAGDALYFICELGRAILRYDLLDQQGLSAIDGCGPDVYDDIVLMPAEEGGLRFAGLDQDDYKLHLWSLETMDPEGVAAWTQNGVIQLDTLLSIADSMHPLNLIGFAKAPDGDVVFVSTDAGVFTIGLESHKVRKVYDKDCICPIFPYRAFFTPV